MSINTIKEIAEAVQAFVTVIAIITGGLWTYKLFVQKKEGHPHAEINHRVSYKLLSQGKALFCLDVAISNIGGASLTLESGMILVKQILPLPPSLIDRIEISSEPAEDQFIEWLLIAFRNENWRDNEIEIYSGETELRHYEFIINADIQTVLVYSRFPYIKRNNRFWLKRGDAFVIKKFLWRKKVKRNTPLSWNFTSIHDLH